MRQPAGKQHGLEATQSARDTILRGACYMYITADYLREQVIKPTLEYLGAWTPEAEQDMLDAALRDTEVGMFSKRAAGLGLFRISSSQHRDLWDRYLAHRPDLASRVRGLASQRAFLSNPDHELQTNLSYCTAIAWLLYQRANTASDVKPPAARYGGVAARA